MIIVETQHKEDFNSNNSGRLSWSGTAPSTAPRFMPGSFCLDYTVAMYIKVYVNASAKKETVKEEKKDEYLISVNVPAERGLANRRALELLRAHLRTSFRVIKIVSGHHSPHKIILIEKIN